MDFIHLVNVVAKKQDKNQKARWSDYLTNNLAARFAIVLSMKSFSDAARVSQSKWMG